MFGQLGFEGVLGIEQQDEDQVGNYWVNGKWQVDQCDQQVFVFEFEFGNGLGCCDVEQDVEWQYGKGDVDSQLDC